MRQATNTTGGKTMKIHSKDFRLPEGDRVELSKWPTKVIPFTSPRSTIRSSWKSMLHN